MDRFLRLKETLYDHSLHIAAAESCTAGLFCSLLADIPGASSVLTCGFVVYTVKSKCDLLGVDPDVIGTYGVVSPQTAEEMALGAQKRAGVEVSVGITGFAGPSADDGMPVGRVCFGYCIGERVYSETAEFGDVGRNAVRQKSAFHAASRLLELLEEEAC